MQPPNTTDGTSPSSRAIEPESNAPSSFDEPMKMPLIDDTRPRMWSGVASCRIVERSTTDTPSNMPDSSSSSADSQKLRRQAKPMMHRPKPATANSSSRPALLCRRMPRQPQAHHHRAQRRRRAQDAQAFRAVVQDFVDECRQQRDRAAEQHREHVQRQRAEQDLVAEHEAQAFADAGEDRRALAVDHGFGDAHRQQTRHRRRRRSAAATR